MSHVSKLKKLGKYNLIASLATGGMAKVYLALMAGPAGFNKLLVVKVLRDDAPSGSEDGIRMFWDEARLSAQLIHPNIVHTFEVGEVDGQYFLAMEYLDGQSYRVLQRKAKSVGGLPLHEELRILSETARGLHAAHELKRFDGEMVGVVHRDVSPQNVFVTYDGQVKLLDFGIAKTRDAEHMTEVGIIKGKLEYIAPEQLRAEPLDRRADIFPLGAMLWEAVTGERFAGGAKVPEMARLHARLSGGEAKVRELKPDVPEALASIIDRAIAVQPSDRFADAAAFADAIDAYLDSVGARPSAKSLAAVVTPMYEAERLAMRNLIDSQLNAIKTGAVEFSESTGDLPPVAGFDGRNASGEYSGRSGTGDSASRSSRGDVRPASALQTGDHVAVTSRKRRVIITTVAAACLLGAGLGLVQPKDAAPPASVEAAAAASATVVPPPAASATTGAATSAPIAAQPAVVSVKIAVSPADAQVSLDGAPLSPPFSLSLVKSGAMHHLQVSREGYRSHKQLVAFTEDRTLDIALEPMPERAHPRAKPHVARLDARAEPERVGEPRAAAVETPSTTREPAPGGDIERKPRTRRAAIDVLDPYATN